MKFTEKAVQEVPEFVAILNTASIFPQMEVLAKDALAFQLSLSYNTKLGPVYQHVPFLFKLGPSPGAFTTMPSEVVEGYQGTTEVAIHFLQQC